MLEQGKGDDREESKVKYFSEFDGEVILFHLLAVEVRDLSFHVPFDDFESGENFHK